MNPNISSPYLEFSIYAPVFQKLWQRTSRNEKLCKILKIKLFFHHELEHAKNVTDCEKTKILKSHKVSLKTSSENILPKIPKLSQKSTYVFSNFLHALNGFVFDEFGSVYGDFNN